MQITSDIELSGAGCTTAITPNQLVQSSSENDTDAGGDAGRRGLWGVAGALNVEEMTL